MGNSISAQVEQLENKQDQQNVKDQLDFMVKAATARLDRYQNELEIMFLDKEGGGSRSVPGKRALRFERGYRCGVSRDSAAGIKNIAKSIFKVAKTAASGEGSLLDGFSEVVENGLDLILGSAQAGEQEDKKFFVFMHHHAIIRIDVKVWKYNFASTGVIANAENVLAYVMCLSVVDHKVLANDELLFLLSEYAGDDLVIGYIDRLRSMWNKLEMTDKKYNKSIAIEAQQAKTEEQVKKEETA